MSGIMEDEDIVKEYDEKVFKRILSYVKPYKGLLFLTFFALTVSTLGELLVPVFEQRLIDGPILARNLALNIELADSETKNELDRLRKVEGSVEAGNYLFLKQDQKLRISASTEKELRRLNIIDDKQWYVFSMTEKIKAAIPGEVEVKTGNGYGAIQFAELNKLPVSTILIIRADDLRRITNVVIMLFVALLFVFGATFVHTWSASLIGQRVMKDIRLDLYKKTIFQSTSFLSEHPVGSLVTRLTGDVETINEFFTSFIVALLKDISIMIGVLVTLFLLSPHLALVVVICLPPVIICTAISRVRARDAFRRQRLASSSCTSYISEHLSGLQVVQLFRREKKTREEFAQRNKELLSANISEIMVFATFRPIVEFIATLTTASLIAVGSSLVLNLSLSIGVLVAFINLVAMFFAPIMDISEKYTILQSAMAGGERVFNLLDTNETIPNNGTQKLAYPAAGNIIFDDIHFGYKKDEEVLKGLSFSVGAGEMAAIVGYTGAGKTTVINLMSRLWDVQSGVIRIDGINIKDIPLPELRKAMLPVLQDVFLFSGTIADNISLGLSLSETQIKDAAKAVYADEFISKLPKGYNTVLSEGATNISGGQRQLLSFARVIAHNPSIVVLDEATSSIDTETERLVQKGIQKVLSGRTSIVIAHRLSTIKDASKILVLKNGKLAEQGKHAELIAKNGLYAGLYRLQFNQET